MITIEEEQCIGCGLCVRDCPSVNLELEQGKAHVLRSSCLLCGHCIAICPKRAVSMDDFPMEDVKEFDQESFEIESENLLNFIKFRRSIRQFKKDPVPKEKLRKMIEAGRFTATGSNRQNVRYIVVEDQLPQLRMLATQRLSDMMRQQATQNPALEALAQRWEKMLESEKEESGKNDRLFFQATAVILLVSDTMVDPALAASNMELMAAAQGLGAFYCGFFVRAAQGHEEISRILELEPGEEIRVCLAVGNPDVHYKRTAPRKPAVISWR